MLKLNLLHHTTLFILLSLAVGIKHTRQDLTTSFTPRHSEEYFLSARGNPLVGEEFIDPYTEDLTTKPISLRYWADDKQIYGLELTTQSVDGEFTNPFHGVTKGEPEEFIFPDQDIDHIILWYDPLSLRGMQIVFVDESTSPQIGGFTSIHTYYTIEGRLVGFFGTAEEKITSLGLVCNKLEPKESASEASRSILCTETSSNESEQSTPTLSETESELEQPNSSELLK